ncbi:unnamed protein product [Trifolium pratense]|uniref:Uncharacterized protein n=1 Tax=Trifolium pratense TaxID=57577 RepID=A0ACB0JIC5_TRIPR|nr:unnamed protein product [Trifolium pratense]
MSRRQRLRKDRLTSLPDEILEHILSYLPTKDSVATSFLSKRWKSQSLWRSQLNLHFEDKTFADSFAFRQFVYSVINTRDTTLPIHSFHLNSHHDFYYDTDFYGFIYEAITRGVQNLIINFSHMRKTTLPPYVLTNKTLSVLKLKRITLNEISNKDDPYFDLPSLKVLHLEYVAFTYYKHIKKLLSACPILEELKLKDIIVKRFAMVLPIDIDRYVLSLSNLVRANISGGYIQLHWLQNIQHFRVELRWINNCLPDMFHNLIHMELIFDCIYPAASFKWNWLIELLQKSPKLQTLIIDEVFNIRHCLFEF